MNISPPVPNGTVSLSGGAVDAEAQNAFTSLEEDESIVATCVGFLPQLSSLKILEPVEEVTIRVPGTSANLGPGFDCIGVALDIWNDLTIVATQVEDSNSKPDLNIYIKGEGVNILPDNQTNLVYVALRYIYKIFKRNIPSLKLYCDNRVPLKKGFGSSSAAIVAGLMAGLRLLGFEMPVEGSEVLLNIACILEGHPDNVAPAIYGGMQIGLFTDDISRNLIDSEKPRWYTSRVHVKGNISCVVFVPSFTLNTSTSRAVLPKKLSMQHSIYNASRCALMVNAFATGNFKELQFAMCDAVHQPYRGGISKSVGVPTADNVDSFAVDPSSACPHLYPLIQVAKSAGALGASLSGAGPAVIAFAEETDNASSTTKAIAKSILVTAQELNVSGRVIITRFTDKGAHFIPSNAEKLPAIQSYYLNCDGSILFE